MKVLLRKCVALCADLYAIIADSLNNKVKLIDQSAHELNNRFTHQRKHSPLYAWLHFASVEELLRGADLRALCSCAANTFRINYEDNADVCR